MRAKANIRGHAIHQMLIPFPLAFLLGGFAFDLAGVLAARDVWWTVGGYLVLAGVVMALIAAVPGFVDYLGTVPPHSSGKRRATLHMAANLAAVGVFAATWLMRGAPANQPETIALAMEAGAALLLGVGGWMGGTLVSRNQIGVDHRYAGAGKWREVRVEGLGSSAAVTVPVGELGTDQMMLIDVDGRRIVAARTADGWVAFDDRCPHRGGSLAGGALVCGTVQCPWHGSQFDVRSGAVRAGPSDKGIRTYAVQERAGQLTINLAERRSASRVRVA